MAGEQPEKINLAFIAGQNSMIVQEIGNTRNDIKDVHGRIDDILKQGYLTRADCDKCQERKHGISPRVALAYTLGGGLVVAIFNKISWINIWHLLKGG